jgi:hypothetical protein
MTRAITEAEQAILQSAGQFSELRLIVITPDVVFVALTNGVPTTNDGVNTVSFDNVSYGASANIVEGMTCNIGTTSGGYDIGTVRVLSVTAIGSGSSISGTLTIGITSELEWQDNAYITVLDEFLIWPKQAMFEGGVFLCDDGKRYTNQHTMAPPAVIMGPDLVLNMGSGSSVSHQLDSSESWLPYFVDNGIGPNPATWSVTGTATISGSPVGTHTPVVTFTQPGNYRLTCVISSYNPSTLATVTGTGRRHVYVYNDATPLVTQFTCENIQGDWQEGGWNFDTTMYAECGLDTIRDRSRIFIVANDYYASGSNVVQQSLGPVAGQEQVLCNGWIDGESISWNPELSTVKFKVHGPQWWLARIASRQTMIRDIGGATPANWDEATILMYDFYLWHVLRWRSTAMEVMDVFRSADTRHMLGATGPVGTLWGQITQVGEAQMQIHPCCNRYGQMYNQIDTNLQWASARAAAPVVMDVTKEDWRETIEIERRIVDDVGWMEVTAFSWTGSGDPIPCRAGSYGTWLGHYGRTDRRTELIVSRPNAQTDTNTLAGILCGNANNDYPRITIPLAGNNRFFDICPNQYGTISMAASDTPLGLTLVSKKFVPRTVQMRHDAETGIINVDITGEGASVIKQGFFLPNPALTPPTTRSPIPGNPWVTGPGPRPPARPVNCTAINAGVIGPYLLGVSATVQTTGGTLSQVVPYHCKIRPYTSTNKTKITVNCSNYYQSGIEWIAAGGSQVRLQVSALGASGSPILTSVQDAYSGDSTGIRTFTFSPAVATEAWGFQFTAISGGTDYTPTGGVLATGTMPYVELGSGGGIVCDHTTYISGSAVGMVDGNTYYIKTTGGPATGPGSFGNVTTWATYAWSGTDGTNCPILVVKDGFAGRSKIDGVYDSYSDMSVQPAPPYRLFSQITNTNGNNSIAYFVYDTSGGVGGFYAGLNVTNMGYPRTGSCSYEVGLSELANDQSKVVINSALIINICNYYDV